MLNLKSLILIPSIYFCKEPIMTVFEIPYVYLYLILSIKYILYTW